MNYLDFYPSILQESRKVAKELVVRGMLSPEEFEQLQTIDPSQTKKYMGWMAKQWVTKSVTDIDELRNKIEEYDYLMEKHADHKHESGPECSGFRMGCVIHAQ